MELLFSLYANRICSLAIFHYGDVIISTIASYITSLTIVYSNVYWGADQRNIKAPRHWPLCGEFTGTGEFPAQRTSNAENVSIWWRHHVIFRCQHYYHHVNPVTSKWYISYEYHKIVFHCLPWKITGLQFFINKAELTFFTQNCQ